MASVFVPVLYMIIVFGGLIVFSSYYRKRAAVILVEPYFPTHAERNTYITLLGKTDPPVSDALLKSALVRRAMADVHRVLRLREDKPALQNLLQKGAIGDDLWNSLLAAEKELEAEIMEVVAEANSFVDGWGQVIFPTANEMIANEKMRSIYEQTAQLRAEAELKYESKARKEIAVPAPVVVAAPPPPSNEPASTSPPQSAVSWVDTPLSATTNGLAPPVTSGAESSDGEGSKPSGAKSTPNKSGKKNKKRK